MRVIGGEFRSRRIKSLPGMEMRPTPDRLRETLFNIISAQIAGSTFLDAYAGTGAVGIEALSRGASHVIFIESHPPAVELIRENLQSLELLGRATVIAKPALRALERHAAQIVFLDPPYPLEAEYAPALASIARTQAGLVIAQHSVRFDPGDTHSSLTRYRTLRHGDNALSFYRKTNPE